MYSLTKDGCRFLQEIMGLLFIKCPECGTKNTQEGFCSSCGAVLSIVLRRRQEDEQKKMQLKTVKPVMKESRADRAVKWFETHPTQYGTINFYCA